MCPRGQIARESPISEAFRSAHIAATDRRRPTGNAIAPGRIDTPLVAMSGAQANARIVGETPMQRLGRTQEVADVIAFLATRQEAGFVTGQVIDMAGGWLMT